MARIGVLASLLACTTLAASAQEAMPAPMIPAPLLSATERSVASGITEQGRASVVLPADRLRLVVRTYGAPPANATPATAAAATVAETSVVDTMRSNGIPDAHIVEAVLGNVGANDQIAGTITKPTRERVAGIERRIVAALPATILPALRNVNLDGMLEVDACAPAIDRARSAAYADARKRAESLALAAGTHVGGLQSASEVDQTQGCVDFGNAPSFNNSGQGAFDGTIAVGVIVNATFAIRP